MYDAGDMLGQGCMMQGTRWARDASCQGQTGPGMPEAGDTEGHECLTTLGQGHTEQYQLHRITKSQVSTVANTKEAGVSPPLNL